MAGIIHHGLRAWERLVAAGGPADEIVARLFDASGCEEWPPRGREAWRGLVREALVIDDAAENGSHLVSLLRDYATEDADRERQPSLPPHCVFVSHRQTDVAEAEALANEILGLGLSFDVWLDIWDPFLGVAQGLPLPPHAKAVVIALIIEMGLVNSRAVVALMSDNAKGSAWIPYEYGRVKLGGPFADDAAASLRGLIVNREPEYMLLGPRLPFDASSATHPDLKDWLARL